MNTEPRNKAPGDSGQREEEMEISRGPVEYHQMGISSAGQSRKRIHPLLSAGLAGIIGLGAGHLLTRANTTEIASSPITSGENIQPLDQTDKYDSVTDDYDDKAHESTEKYYSRKLTAALDEMLPNDGLRSIGYAHFEFNIPHSEEQYQSALNEIRILKDEVDKIEELELRVLAFHFIRNKVPPSQILRQIEAFKKLRHLKGEEKELARKYTPKMSPLEILAEIEARKKIDQLPEEWRIKTETEFDRNLDPTRVFKRVLAHQRIVELSEGKNMQIYPQPEVELSKILHAALVKKGMSWEQADGLARDIAYGENSDEAWKEAKELLGIK